jgi:histidine triad (HIT) family protein
MGEVDECVICRIVAGKLPSTKVYEDESFLGILDVNPCAEGHCLVVPKDHIVRFYDMDDDMLGRLFRAVKIVAARIKLALEPDFVCVFVRGGRISHLHVAVFPSMQGDSLSGFPQSSLGTVSVDPASVAARLSAADNRCQ